MARIKGKHSKPEMIVRRLLHKMGYRYRLHASDITGRPDIVVRKTKRAIFVHGCFWHQHNGCRRAKLPSTRPEFWAAKLAANVQRDQRVVAELVASGWKVLTIWECQLGDEEALAAQLRAFLATDPNGA